MADDGTQLKRTGYEVGSRVGAISHEEKDGSKVHVFGYGVYEGDYPYGDETSTGGRREFLFSSKGYRTNPRIRLDDGKVVWGCECWWGPEDLIKDRIGDRPVEMIDPVEARVAAMIAAASKSFDDLKERLTDDTFEETPSTAEEIAGQAQQDQVRSDEQFEEDQKH